MPKLSVDLPSDLYWLKDQVEALIRPAAFLTSAPVEKTPTPWVPGTSCVNGLPDVPADAPWLDALRQELPFQSPHDGPSFWLQLNLEEIPSKVRKSDWPTVGVVWLFLDLEGRWKAITYFDPRPAKEIPWLPVLEAVPSLQGAPLYVKKSLTWAVQDTLPCCTEEILPEVFWVDYSAQAYDDWVATHYVSKRKSCAQVGGWIWPVQGEFDDRNKDIVCAMEQQGFGDGGAVYLHYNSARGFYGLVDTH